MSSRPHHGTLVGTDQKVCMGCGKTLPLTDYYKNPGGLAGRQSRRKPCFRLQLKATPDFQKRKSAREAVRLAVKSGRLVKPAMCSACGKATEVDGHHDDYSKKLEVRWLCEPCHEDEHRGQAYGKCTERGAA